MNSKILVIDVETTGTKHWQHCIHELACLVVVDNEIQESLDLKIRPHELAIIDEQTLKAGNVTLEQIQAYPHRSEQFNKFKALLGKYVDPYDSTDKFTLVGFKNASFDDEFLRNFFVLEDGNFGSYFWANSIDVSCLAAQYLLPVRHTMPSFKLSRVAKWQNIPVLEESLHTALYDCELTWEVYQCVRGKKIDDL